MNFIQKIRTNLNRPLHIILDDEEIIVSRLGIYDNQMWYSWITWGPNESNIPSFTGNPVTATQIRERLSLLSDDENLDEKSVFAINRFFGSNL
jgi:hypothetical protein